MNPAGTEPSQRVEIVTLDANGKPIDKSKITAQYNPTSLQYTITNTAAQGSSRQRSRAVDESTGKLTMDLIFDTTDTGVDVRQTTQQIAMLMMPDEKKGKLTPIVQVTWGNVFKFKGALDQYRETLDFFSEGGVPLRASLSLGFTTIAEKNKSPADVFAFASTPKPPNDADNQAETKGKSPTEIANAFGDPSRAREIAAKNDVEDIRNGDGGGAGPDAGSDDNLGDSIGSQNTDRDEGDDDDDTLVIGDDVPLDPPVAFATGAAGVGASAGAGFGAGAGASFNAGAGASFGASAGAGVGASFGASAGAGFGASAGAGAGFGAGTSFGASAGVTAGVSGGFGASSEAGASFSASATAFAGAGGFAAVGASSSAPASAGFSASASFSPGASGTFSDASFSANASVRSGSVASAGVSASAGAFARLRPPAPQSRGTVDLSRLFPTAASVRLTTDTPGAFGPGGIVVRTGSSQTTADVGHSVSLSERIEFED